MFNPFLVKFISICETELNCLDIIDFCIMLLYIAFCVHNCSTILWKVLFNSVIKLFVPYFLVGLMKIKCRKLKSFSFFDQISIYRNKYGYSYVKSLCVNKDLHKNEDSGESLQYLGETYLCLLRSIEGAKVCAKVEHI